jgi:hypothetical protein
MNRASLVKSFLSVASAILLTFCFAATSVAQNQTSALTCADFKPTAEALTRFPDLTGACEEVVERNGELYAKFVAIVRRASNRSVTLYLPATEHTFTVKPDSDARVLLGGRSSRIRDLARGQEVRIYLSTRQFASPNIEEIAFVTEEKVLLVHRVTPAAALPTTASIWPTVGLAGFVLFMLGLARRRLQSLKLRNS